MHFHSYDFISQKVFQLSGDIHILGNFWIRILIEFGAPRGRIGNSLSATNLENVSECVTSVTFWYASIFQYTQGVYTNGT